MRRSPENTAGAQDLERKEENLSVGQDWPGLAGKLATASRTRMVGGHGALGGGTALRRIGAEDGGNWGSACSKHQ